MSLKRKEPDSGFEGHEESKRPAAATMVQQVIAKAPVVQITTRPAVAGTGDLAPSLSLSSSSSSSSIGPALPPSAIPSTIDTSNAAPYPVGYMPKARTSAVGSTLRGAPIVSGASLAATHAPSPIAARVVPLAGSTSTGVSVLQSIATRTKTSTPEPTVKKHMRSAAGVVWEDPTLTAWNDDDYRIFVGDLGNECTDEMLKQAFLKYPSFQRARVVRDKKSYKTKGYGFVSFTDAGDYMKAMKEMQGKYIGNRPVKLRKSRWQDREA